MPVRTIDWAVPGVLVALAMGVFLFPSGGRPIVPQLGEQCRWDAAVASGQLDPETINEASGLAVSTTFPDRLYHVNDSGDSGRFFTTRLNGDDLAIVNVEGFEPRDVEDLTVGPCGTSDGTCLFIADIGDNARVREELTIVVVLETEAFGETVSPVERIRVRYPDSAYDAESIAVHPNGDLFILTKGANQPLIPVAPSRLYRLGADRRRLVESDVLTLELVATVDFVSISSDTVSGSMATSMDISPGGGKFLVLTYVNAFEFYFDLATDELPSTPELDPGMDFVEIPLTLLRQQESLAYLGENAFLYDTEAVDGTAPVYRVRCRG